MTLLRQKRLQVLFLWFGFGFRFRFRFRFRLLFRMPDSGFSIRPFYNLWHRDAEVSRRGYMHLKSTARWPENLRRVPTSSSLPDNLHRHASDSGIDLPNMTQFQSSKETKYPIKRLTVKRPSNSSWRSRPWRWFVSFFCG